MIKHYMLDIETLSTKPNAVVLSIGAVEFDPETGDIIREFYQELDLQDQPDRHIDISTVQWWADRCKENVSNLDLLAKPKQRRLSTMKVLGMLDNFINYPQSSFFVCHTSKFVELERDEFNVAVWACDPDFDVTILNNLYESENIRCPWRYNEPKSFRTIRLLAEMKGIALPKAEASHNALEDCIRQVKEVSTFIKNISKV